MPRQVLSYQIGSDEIADGNLAQNKEYSGARGQQAYQKQSTARDRQRQNSFR